MPTNYVWEFSKTVDTLPSLGNDLLNAFKTAGHDVSTQFFGQQASRFQPYTTDLSEDLDALAVPCMGYLVGSVKGQDGHPDFSVAINQGVAAQNMKSWFSDKGKRVGADMVNHNVSVQFDQWMAKAGGSFNPNDLKEILLDSNGTFIKGVDVQTAVEQNVLHVQVFLILVKRTLGDSTLAQVKEAWRKHDASHFDLVFQLVDGQFNFFENFHDTNAFLDLAHELYGTVQSKCLAYEKHQDSDACYPVGVGGGLVCTPGDIHETWGSGVESWLNSQKQPYLNGIFTSPPNNHRTSSGKRGGGGGCFLAGTTVLMITSDGSSVERVPIENVKEGDLIISHNGSLSVVSDEPVVRQMTEDVIVYGIKTQHNHVDISPFFTKAHPFWTAEGGWCAICPRCANAENEWLRAKMLGVGSTVFQVQHAKVKKNKPFKVKVSYDPVRIEEIAEEIVKKPVIYGLHFREGGRSYHANGFLVGVNYPELTSSGLTHRLASAKHMHHTDRQQLHEALYASASGLTQAIGSDWPHHGIGRAVDEVKHTGPQEHHRNNHFYRHHSSLFQAYHIAHLTYKLHKVDDSTPAISTHIHLRPDKNQEVVPECGKLYMVRGKVAVDEQVAHDTHFTDDGYVVARFSPSMILLRMQPSGLGGFAVKGRLSEDHTRVEAIEERYAVGAENTYNTKYLDGDTWIDWFQMHTGLDSGIPMAFFSDPSKPSTSATNKILSKACTLTLENGQLQVQLEFGQYSFMIGWHSGDGLISHDLGAVNGTLYKYDSTQENGKGTACRWTGIIATAHEHSARESSLNAKQGELLPPEAAQKDSVDFRPLTAATPVMATLSMTSEIPTSTEEMSAIAHPDSEQVNKLASEFAAKYSVPVQPLTAATPVWAASSMNLMASEIPMSTEELSEMAPPDSEQVNRLSFDKLTNLMKATVSSSTLATLLDDAPPILSSEEQAIIDDPTNGSSVRKFLAEKFFRAYAVQALSGSSQLEKDFSGVSGGVEATKERLHYFWQGAGKAADVVTADASKANNVLSQDSSFDFVNNRVARIAYSESLPALQRYLQNDPVSWADKLHKFVTRTDYVRGLAVLTAASDNSQLNKLSMILYSLAPGEKYATDLCARVLEAQTNYLRQHFGSLDAGLMKIIIPAIITKLVNLVDADDPSIKLSAQIKAEIVSQIRTAMIEANSENAEAFVSKYQSLWEECAVFMSANRDQPVWQRLSEWWAKIGEMYPKTTKLGSALVTLFGQAVWITTIGVSVMSLVVLSKNWNTLRTDQKVALIAQGSAVLSDVIAKAQKAWNGLMDVFNFEDMFTFESTFEEEDLQELWGPYLDQTAVEYNPEMELGDLSNPGTGAAGAVAAEDVQAMRIWENFSIAEKVARLTNVVAMGAAVVSMGFQVSEDFKTNQPVAVKVLDIINVVAAGIGFAAESIALAGELGAIALSEFIAGAVIPIVGAVVAIVGVIVTIVLMFVHKKPKPQETPIDKWVKGIGVPFVNQLPTPTADWKNQHKDSTKG